jgi:hypothetical protein
LIADAVVIACVPNTAPFLVDRFGGLWGFLALNVTLPFSEPGSYCNYMEAITLAESLDPTMISGAARPLVMT